MRICSSVDYTGPLVLPKGRMNSSLSIRLSVCNTVFSGLALYCFLIFTWNLGSINTWKWWWPLFAENIIPRIGRWGIFGPKSTFLIFSLNLFFFWQQVWRMGKSDFVDFQGKFLLCLNGVNVSFWAVNQYFFNFPLNLLIKIFRNYTWW